MHYTKFEDLPVWQEARKFFREIHELIESTTALRNNYRIRDQLYGASSSIMLNIAEGFERHSNKEFSNFLNIAKGSAGETRCILYLLLDIKMINENQFLYHSNNVISLSAQLANLRKYLLNNQK